MLCPVCGNAKLKIDETKPDSEDGTRINRKRRCKKCGIGWPTKEIPEDVYFMLMVREGDEYVGGQS